MISTQPNNCGQLTTDQKPLLVYGPFTKKSDSNDRRGLMNIDTDEEGTKSLCYLTRPNLGHSTFKIFGQFIIQAGCMCKKSPSWRKALPFILTLIGRGPELGLTLSKIYLKVIEICYY